MSLTFTVNTICDMYCSGSHNTNWDFLIFSYCIHTFSHKISWKQRHSSSLFRNSRSINHITWLLLALLLAYTEPQPSKHKSWLLTSSDDSLSVKMVEIEMGQHFSCFTSRSQLKTYLCFLQTSVLTHHLSQLQSLIKVHLEIYLLCLNLTLVLNE